MFSLTSLKCFAVAAQEMNFSRAAKQLYISQQALSSHIAKLEDYYGVKLFDRAPPLSLTEAGISLQKYASEIFSSVDNCAKEVQDIKNFQRGELTVGVPVTRGTVMLPPLLSAFHRMYPQINLHLAEGSTNNMLDTLLNGRADLVLGYQPQNMDRIVCTRLYEEKFYIVVPKRMLKEYFSLQQHSQLQKQPLKLSTFAALPFVVQNQETMNGHAFQSMCEHEGVTPNIVVSTQNLITLVSLCMEEMGACVVPHTFLSSDRRFSNLERIPLFNQDSLDRVSIFQVDSSSVGTATISVCRLRDKVLTHAAREFINLAQEIFRENPDDQMRFQSRF